MSKAKNNKPQEQPAAAPAEATEVKAPNTEEQPKEAAAQDAAPAADQPQEQPAAEQADPRVLEVKRALRSFPTLEAGYIVPLTRSGKENMVCFDKAVAEAQLAEGEELIIVERENKR